MVGMSEHPNVEHLLDASMSPQAEPNGTRTGCDQFLDHLYRHKSRPVILGLKIESILDSSPERPKRLSSLADLVHLPENIPETRRPRS